MWFGDLVTMKWWDDLWLNESFAEWACYHAAVEATEFTEAWTGFTNARKNWAYRQDQLPSTHPIAADNVDLRAVEVNFDGITYAKGASVLKQLVAWVGLDNFLDGPARLLQGPRVRQHRVRRPAGRAREGLRPRARALGAGVAADRRRQHARARVRARRRRQLRLVRGRARPRTPDYPTLRRHRLGIGLYDEVDGRLVRRTVPRDRRRRRARPRSPSWSASAQPDLLLLNDGDLAYAKIRLDERSLATVVGGIATLDDSLARALCWGAAWDMTRDAEMRGHRLRGAGARRHRQPRPTRPGVTRLPTYAAMAVERSTPRRSNRAALRGDLGAGPARAAQDAEPGSDHQLTLRAGLRRGRAQRRGAGRPRRRCSTARSRSTAWRSTPTCAGRCSTALAPQRPRRRRPDRRGAGARQHDLRPGARRRRPGAAARPPRPRPRRGRSR